MVALTLVFGILFGLMIGIVIYNVTKYVIESRDKKYKDEREADRLYKDLYGD